MPTARSQVPGGLPRLEWQGTSASNTRRAAAAAAAARDTRAAERCEAIKAALVNPNDANNVPPDGDANCNPKAVANANKPNPHNQNPPCEVWMGIQVFGVRDEDAAKSLAKKPFMSNFSGSLKVTEEDVKDAFKSSEKRSENNITVEPFIKEKVLAFLCWVKTCFWLNIDPEQAPFPIENADTILDQSKLHSQFLADALDNKTTVKPKPFTKDHKFDEWAEAFKECLTLLPGCTGPPLACVICKRDEPALSLTATDKENFISMAQLSGSIK